jgi:hypothetical protein
LTILGNAHDGNYITRFFATLLSFDEGKPMDYQGDPFSFIYFPVFDNFEEDARKAVGVVFIVVSWADYFADLLPDNILGLTIVLENGCDSAFTFVVNGKEVVFIGEGDHHDPTCKFDVPWRLALRSCGYECFQSQPFDDVLDICISS